TGSRPVDDQVNEGMVCQASGLGVVPLRTTSLVMSPNGRSAAEKTTFGLSWPKGSRSTTKWWLFGHCIRTVLLSGRVSMIRALIAHMVFCSAIENRSANSLRMMCRTEAKMPSQSASSVLYSSQADTSVDMIRSVVSARVVYLPFG